MKYEYENYIFLKQAVILAVLIDSHSTVINATLRRVSHISQISQCLLTISEISGNFKKFLSVSFLTNFYVTDKRSINITVHIVITCAIPEV
jgi:hypothetical protein